MTSPLSVRIGSDASYSLNVDGITWLDSGPTRLHGAPLTALHTGRKAAGQDILGRFVDFQLDYSCESLETDVCFSTIIRDYTPSGLPLVSFHQRHVKARNSTAVGSNATTAKDAVLSAFPSFKVSALPASAGTPHELGAMIYYDQMLGGQVNGTRFIKWNSTNEVVGGSKGGPTVLFDAAQTRAMVLSPWREFMAGSSVQRFTGPASFLDFGLLGSITSVPAGFEFASAAYVGSGVNAAVRGFGAALLKFYGKQGQQWDGNGDLSLAKIGLSTDNGAYYYYWAGDYPSPEVALEATAKAAAAERVPFAYVLLDSWWYYKGVGDGVKNWTARPDAFPHGLKAFTNATTWPVVGHNRYWSSNTDYARANGGRYNFIVEPQHNLSIPDDARFWDDLLGEAKSWGLVVYEQDWLHNEWAGLDATLTSATLSRRWLQQMGDGATKHGLGVQYCMAYSRFALASVEIAAVDQIRVSDDYYVDLVDDRIHATNVRTGVTSMLAAALGLAPSKDTFWSTTDQMGAPANPRYHEKQPKKYGPIVRERHPALEAAISTFTAGPVALGDAAGATNGTLARCICATDGTLLKPTWPATPIDAYFSWRAHLAAGPDGELYATYSSLPLINAPFPHNPSYVVGHVIAMDLAHAYQLSLTQVPQLATDVDTYVVWAADASNCAGALRTGSITRIGPRSRSLSVQACGKSDFQLFHASPEIRCGDTAWALLGEEGKWVPVSSQRFGEVVVSATGLSVWVSGSEDERVVVNFARRNVKSGATEVVKVLCVLTASGRAVAGTSGNCAAAPPRSEVRKE